MSRSPLIPCLAMLAAFAVACPALHAQPRPRTIELPFQQWQSEPERREIKWDLSISGPRLTYDLRHLMLIDLEVAESTLAAIGPKPDLHLLIKAGDGVRWYEAEDYLHFVPPQLGEKLTVQFLTAVYLRPGRHRIGIVLYDAASTRRSVTHRWVTIPADRKNPLAILDNALPPAEFATATRNQTPTDRWKKTDTARSGPHLWRHSLELSDKNEVTMLSRTPDPRSLPLRNAAPLEFDVLVNFTPTSQFESSNTAYSISKSAMWGILRVLALLKPRSGCVLMTGIDVLGEKVIFDRVNAATVNWEALADAVSNIDANTVDLQTLEGHRRMSEFFRNQVSRVTEGDAAACPNLPRGQPVEHIYIIAADGVSFPSGTSHTHVEPGGGRRVKLYYFRRGNLWDEMERIVKPFHPHHLNADTSEKFRHSLAHLLADVGGLQ